MSKFSRSFVFEVLNTFLNIEHWKLVEVLLFTWWYNNFKWTVGLKWLFTCKKSFFHFGIFEVKGQKGQKKGPGHAYDIDFLVEDRQFHFLSNNFLVLEKCWECGIFVELSLVIFGSCALFFPVWTAEKSSHRQALLLDRTGIQCSTTLDSKLQ